MNRVIAFLFLLFPLIASAQPDLTAIQQQWIEQIKSGKPIASFNRDNGHLLWMDIEVKASAHINELLNKQGIAGIKRYNQDQQFKHDAQRYITAGTIITEEQNVLLATGWRKTHDEWKKEMDVLLNLHSSARQVDEKVILALESERGEWVKRANKHDPAAHIGYSYLADAVYFSNGRRTDGRDGITKRYAYMKNPNYQVDLEKQYLRQISPQKVLEIGRYYAGQREDNRGGLYLIVWQKSEKGDWKIGLDFNF